MGIITGPGVIEGGIGPVLTPTAPVDGTNEVQTLTIGGTPTGGTFKLGFGGFATPPITWHATTGTFLANINAALQGKAAVQLISFLNISSGTFRLRFRGQTTAVINWHATPATLASNIDTALEALSTIGTSGVAAAAVTSGTPPALVTVGCTFAAFGPQPLIEVTDVRVVRADVDNTDATIVVTTTTAGVAMNSIGKIGVVATDSTLVSGIGDVLLTFSGVDLGKKAQPLITVADNSLTGTTPTVAVAETTPGVTATARGLLPGGHVIDYVAAKDYLNEGTVQAPTYADITT